MTVRRLDDNGDITTSGDQFITEQDEIAQTISTRLRLFAREYFRDTSDGTPWFERVLGKGAGLYERDAVIRRRISQTENVLSITSYEADFNLTDREYIITVSVLTTFGELSLSVEGL